MGGREENSQIPAKLTNHLMDFIGDRIETISRIFDCDSVCLFGEGYGIGINKAGKFYNDKTAQFVLFDVKIGDLWLKRESVEDIANNLHMGIVPIIRKGTLTEAIDFVRAGFNSTWGDFPAEGLVVRPSVELRDRQGKRIISKIKTKDFLR